MKINSTQRSEEQQIIVNSYEPGVNDELATVTDSKSVVDSAEPGVGSRESGVNDDLALCSSVVSREFGVMSRESIVDSRIEIPAATIVTFTKVPYNNGPDPERASGSFVFPGGRSVSVVRLCQIILQPIFNAVELFKKDTPALIPVRVKDNNVCVSQIKRYKN